MDERPEPAHDVLTALAIAVVVYVVAKLVHEALGHGLICVLVDGELRGFSTSWCDCDKALVSEWGDRAVKGGGTLANLIVGGVFLGLSRRGRIVSGAAYYFVWLSAAVNLFVGSGYLMVDPLFRFGDWGAFVAGLPLEGVWRVALAVTGAALSLATFFALRAPLQRLLGTQARLQRRAARVLCWLPWLAVGGVIMTGAALLNVLGPAYAFTSALATLGGTFLMVWLPLAVDPRGGVAPARRREIRRSPAWLAAGAVTLVGLVALLGPGARF
ncbi:MAG: hypothetical protein IT385_10715 [Deltaproteobacteria bacterium]|nr:hypothetical protein [Deltaproteobacteria bacterium]